MKRLSVYILLLLPVLLGSGCIGDDVSDCPSTISLKVTAEITVGSPSADNTFNQTGVYVFDTSGVLVDYGRFVSDGGTSDQVVELTVAEGQYTIVTWCGADFSDDYEVVAVGPAGTLTGVFVKGETRLADMRLRAKADGVSNTRMGNLFWSELTKVTVTRGVNQVRLNSQLQKNSNLVEVVLKGVGEVSPTSRAGDAPADSRYEVRLSTVAGVYNFDNTTDRSLSSDYVYLPYEAESKGGDLYMRLRTMRLFIDTPVTLTVTDRRTGAVLYSADLIELIMKNPAYKTQEDLDREDVYRIEVGGGSTTPGTGITITVNGWEVIVLVPGYG